MIALQSLKYFIWDYCLTKLFEGFQKNFKFGNEHLVNVKDLYIGQKLYKVIKGEFIFYNCEVVRLYNSNAEINNGNGVSLLYQYREKFGTMIYESGRLTIIVWDDTSTDVEFIEFI